jgi:hypothetical protein
LQQRVGEETAGSGGVSIEAEGGTSMSAGSGGKVEKDSHCAYITATGALQASHFAASSSRMVTLFEKSLLSSSQLLQSMLDFMGTCLFIPEVLCSIDGYSFRNKKNSFTVGYFMIWCFTGFD